MVWACPNVSGLPSTALAQGNQPLSQDFQEAPGAPAWKPSAQHAANPAFLVEHEAASLVCLQALLGKAQVRHQNGRPPAFLRVPIWQSPWHEAALPLASLAQTCLAARVTAKEGAGYRRLGDATGAFLASALFLLCLYT